MGSTKPLPPIEDRKKAAEIVRVKNAAINAADAIYQMEKRVERLNQVIMSADLTDEELVGAMLDATKGRPDRKDALARLQETLVDGQG